MMHPTVTGSVLVLALVLAGGCGAVAADGRRGHRDWDDPDHSYDRARRAAERGEILTLTEIYARAARRFPGRVLEAELELEDTGTDAGAKEGRDGRHWVYDLKILEDGGRLRKVYMDAHNGEVLEHEEDD